MYEVTENGKTLVRASVIRSTILHEAKHLDFRHFRGVHKVTNFYELYDIKKRLGAGAFGEVYEALNIKANVTCAVKKICKKKVYGSKTLAAAVKTELAVL